MSSHYTRLPKIVFLALLLPIAISCGTPDKAAELDALRQQKTDLEAKISQLESELGSKAVTSSGKVADVLVTPIEVGYFAHLIDVQGTVEADEAVELRPAMAGTVTVINVKEGDQVKKGQVLAETNNEIYVRQLNSLKPQLDLANELYDRQGRLWAQKIGSEIQLLQAKTQKESLEKQVETIQEQIELTRIKSPINGTVDMVGIKLGQLASAGVIQPAFRVVNAASLKVVSHIAESNSSKVTSGNLVLLQFPDLGEEISSKITFTSRSIDPITRTFTAHASLPNNPSYRPNMIVVMRIVDYENQEAITVPVNLVQSGNSQSFVYVATTGPDAKKTAKKRVVETGKSYGSQIEIISGLLAGDLLITTGYSELTDGMELKF